MTKAGLFYHYMRHILKNNNAHIMVNYSHSPIPKLEENNKQYTARDVNRADHARWFQNIYVQPVKQILHKVDNKILQHLPILQEDVGIAEDIYGPSV